MNDTAERVAMRCKRQDLVDTLRRAEFAEAAEEALRILPDPVDSTRQ